MKKSGIIAIISGLAIVGLGVIAVVQLNRASSGISFFAVILSLVPMYFLYSAVVLGRYDKKDSRPKRDYDIEKSLSDKRKKNKASKDYGKMLDFPADKNNKKDKK